MTPDPHGLTEDMLSAYLDDELSAADRRRVADTVAVDPAWAAVLDDVAIAREAVRALPPRDLPGETWRTILDTVDRAGTEPVTSGDDEPVTHLDTRRRPRVVRWVAAGAAAAAALALFLVPGARTPDVNPPLDDIADTAAVAQTTASDPVTGLVPVGVQAGLAP